MSSDRISSGKNSKEENVIKYKTVILAGGRAPWLKGIQGTETRILAQVCGMTFLERLVQALRGSGRVSRIVVAVNEEALQEVDAVLPAGVELSTGADSAIATCIRAAEMVGAESDEKILVVCDDVPLLTSDAVLDFIQQCEEHPQKQVFYPIVSKENCLKAYPEAKRTYGGLKNGTFTGGNIFMIEAGVMPRGEDQAKWLYQHRKQPMALCRWLGWGFVLKLFLNQLDTAAVERRVSELLRLRCQVIISRFASIGMDVDKPEDLELAHKYLEK